MNDFKTIEEQIERVRVLMADIESVRFRYDELQAEGSDRNWKRDLLRAADTMQSLLELRLYVQHKDSCQLITLTGGGSTDWEPKCTCGLNDVLAKLKDIRK